MLKKALYWEKTGENIRCLLCPHFCIILDNEQGKCRKRINNKGVLYTNNYSFTTSLNLDPLEKKPLYHFFPTEEVLSLGSNSCNLSCKFCQNYTISQFDCPVIQLSPDDLVKLCLEKSIKHVAFTYTEPFTWFEYILDAIKVLRYNNISTILVTNGYVNQEPLIEIISYISAMNIDLKAYSNSFYQDICGGNLQPVLNTIEYSYNKTHVEITLLLIENLNDNPDELNKLFKFIGNLNKNIPLHISKYFPRYLLKSKETSENALLKAVKIAKNYLNFVYVGNLRSDYSNTYCPQCQDLLIKRQDYNTKILGLNKGICSKCQFPIIAPF
ncbi:MAG: AmmeMemoRadiSam system radical SAM enzyme [Candidatus Cloacimonetes bacterium]|nr:AmmeMemoRadiSam system radical SAM enzyme [Candidatus Cloacimonadota bacterium]